MLHQALAGFAAHRLSSGPLPGGSAPYTSSNPFKIAQSSESRPTAKKWDHRLSLEASRRIRSTLKASSILKDPSAVISLGTGRPTPRLYPWEAVQIQVTDVESMQDREPSKNMTSMSCRRGELAYDLDVALNYGYAAGSPQVLRFITEHIEMIHNPPYADWESALTCGTTSAIEIVLRMLCNSGDCLITEQHTYPGAIEAAKALGLRILGIRMDAEGLLPDDLDSKLRNWNDEVVPKPSVLYTIPCGQNPTGATQPFERRKAIYEVAEQHDLLIIEDDPYLFLQLEDPARSATISMQNLRSAESYLKKLPPSYLSLDKSGRVLRLDATSKILAPGLRIGWITGCAQLIEKFVSHTELSTVAPSGPSQVMLYKLLDETWGHEGFIDWLEYLSSQYRKRLNILEEACKQYLPSHICTWTLPKVGMFLWIRIDWIQHPTVRLKHAMEGAYISPVDVEDSIYSCAMRNGVAVSKGSWFAANRCSVKDVYFRMTFAAATEDDLAQAVERFGRAIREEFVIG